MKKTLLYTLLSLLLISTQAQEQTKEKYPVSGGLLGGVNLSKFRFTGNNTGNIDYKFHTGFMGGFWLNFPLNKTVSFEPELLYSMNSFKQETNATGFLTGKMYNFSIPLQFKFHAGKAIAFGLGAQVDFLTSVKDDNNNLDKEDFQSINTSLLGGVEIFPHAPVTIFGRYLYGLKNLDGTGNPNTAVKFFSQNIQAGLKLRLFGKKKEMIIPPPPPPKDTDGDGIIDDNDKCPTVPGIAKYDGCPIPDTDKDGINDEEDKCPNVPGLPRYQGCPIPDTDGDGFNDEVDKCPAVPGVAEYQGCPVPDRDKDGIPDPKDKCPDVPGVASHDGCPEITEEVMKKVEYAAKNVYFNTGSTKLLAKSHGPLDAVVAIMNENKDVKLKIDGHTDNVGADDFNMRLSDGRAASVKTYLISKGISENRLVSEGFGESQPVADNKTATGRQKNRRVEMKLYY